MDKITRWIALLAAAVAASLASPALAEDKTPDTSAQATASADGSTAGNAETPATVPAHPALWKVADEDTTIYLFGTIHALPSGIDWFEGKVAAAFDESGELVTEIVKEDPKTMQGLVLSRAMLSGDQTLRSLLNPEEKADYEAALTSFGVPVQAFDRFEPWYAAVGLSTVPLMRDGFAAEHGVEETLNARAESLGHTHGALETAEYQLDLFDALPLDVQKRYLDQVVEDLPTMREDLKKMVEAWKRGDAEELARLMNAQEDDPALVEALLTGRNRKWAKWIEERLEKPGTVFLAVGAGHLAGEGSVQDQLGESGITAERVQ